MKIIISMALSVMLFTATATAQSVNLGLKAGVNVYNIESDNGVDYSNQTSFNAGLLGHIHLAPQFALQPEIYYSGQGAKYKSPTINGELKLGYINVPLNFQYMFDNGFRLQAGPQVGFLVSAKGKINNGAETDVKDQFKKIDFGVTAGVSYVHPPSGFGVDARYNLGLSNIAESGSDAKNRGFAVGVFYLLKHRN